MYQNEVDDRITTPAYLLLMPLNVSGVPPLLNFRDIGVSTLRESSAFAKIRNFTKAYSTHLVTIPSPFSTKYQRLTSLYIDENLFLPTTSFGNYKQHNMAAISTLGNGFMSTLLDTHSFLKFLDASAYPTSHTPSHKSTTSSIIIPTDSGRRISLFSHLGLTTLTSGFP